MLDLVLMFIRVAIITTLWIGLFLGAMFGYLTAPFIVLIVFIAIYAVVDRYRVRRRLADDRRRRILEAFDELDPDGADRARIAGALRFLDREIHSAHDGVRRRQGI